VIPSEVALLLEAVPEFADRYLDLVRSADDDPGAAAAISELAEFVTVLAQDPGCSPDLMSRCFAGVERVAAESEDAEELVGWCFLEGIGPEQVERFGPWLGQKTSAIAQRLEIMGDPDA
jgi:hypothetical protein